MTTGIKGIENRCKAIETYKGNRTEKIRQEVKSTSQKLKEGDTRPQRPKCSVLKLESQSQRELLRDVA